MKYKPTLTCLKKALLRSKSHVGFFLVKVEGSNVAINLLTMWRETKNFSHHDAHVNATYIIANVKSIDSFCFPTFSHTEELK